MAIFQDARLEWNGKPYFVRSGRMMGAIAAVEQFITGKELFDYFSTRNTVPMAKIAQGYAALLQYAGAEVQADEVYAGMFRSGEAQETVNAAVHGLLALMTPPDSMITAGDRAAGKKKPAAAKSSRTRTGPRSVPGV